MRREKKQRKDSWEAYWPNWNVCLYTPTYLWVKEHQFSIVINASLLWLSNLVFIFISIYLLYRLISSSSWFLFLSVYCVMSWILFAANSWKCNARYVTVAFMSMHASDKQDAHHVAQYTLSKCGNALFFYFLFGSRSCFINDCNYWSFFLFILPPPLWKCFSYPLGY